MYVVLLFFNLNVNLGMSSFLISVPGNLFPPWKTYSKEAQGRNEQQNANVKALQNSETPFLDQRYCEFPVKVYFLKGKHINIVCWTFSIFFFSLGRIFPVNHEELSYLVYF